MSRFRVFPGKVMVIPPGEPPSVEPVNLIYDVANDAFGVQATGGGQLRGYVFFVSRAALAATRTQGRETNELRNV